MQRKLDEILNNCENLILSNEQTHNLLERINNLKIRINLNLTLSSVSTNGFHHMSKQQVRH